MSAVRVVRARRGHALAVARRLDPATIAAAKRLGHDPRRLLLECLARSPEAWALLADGRALAVGGWRGHLLGERAEAWIAASPEARVYPLALARAAALAARRLLARGMTISASVACGDPAALRLARFCGLDPVAGGGDGQILLTSGG